MTAAASMRAMTEQIFHTYQSALGMAHPKIFGVLGDGCPKIKSERRLAPDGLLGSARDFLRKLIGRSQSSIDQCGKANHFQYDNGLSNHMDRKLAAVGTGGTVCSGGTGPQVG